MSSWSSFAMNSGVSSGSSSALRLEEGWGEGWSRLAVVVAMRLYLTPAAPTLDLEDRG
jgi:hypothetical protein